MTTRKSTPLLDQLLDRIERLKPNKSELARFLGVDRQRVYAWVTARTIEPGGETTLLLQQRAEKQEVEQKSRRDAETPRRRKALLARSYEDTRKQGRRPK